MHLAGFIGATGATPAPTWVTLIIAAAGLLAGAALLLWFARQPKDVRRDVIQLIRALRRK